jgi:hypothetical protein
MLRHEEPRSWFISTGFIPASAGSAIRALPVILRPATRAPTFTFFLSTCVIISLSSCCGLELTHCYLVRERCPWSGVAHNLDAIGGAAWRASDAALAAAGPHPQTRCVLDFVNRYYYFLSPITAIISFQLHILAVADIFLPSLQLGSSVRR